MTEIVQLVGSFGGLVVMAALFVWTYTKEKSKSAEENEKRVLENKEMLDRIDKSNENIAKSIDAINNTTNVLKEYIITHEDRAKRIENSMKELLERSK